MVDIALHRARRPLRLLSLAGYGLGVATVLLALASYLTQWQLTAIFAWVERVFSLGFLLIFGGLCSLTLYAGWQLGRDGQPKVWLEVAHQSANGIATMALTFTLLGISMGIGALGEQQLSPETIQGIIQTLTQHFSMAFMTTVIGLPTASLLRAIIAVRWARLQHQPSYGE